MSQIDPKNLKAAISVESYYREQLGEPAQVSGGKRIYFCPFHPDRKTPNFTVFDDGGFKCFACGASDGDVIAFHQKQHNLSFPDTLRELAAKYAPALLKGLDGNARAKTPRGKPVAKYIYQKEDGSVWFEVLRFEPKTFRQRILDGQGGYKWGRNGREPILYRLPELIKGSDPVFICEGEKDADRMASLGLTATTSPMGAGKWKQEFSAHFEGREAVVLEDNDAAGSKHGRIVAESLSEIAKTIRVLRFPELPKGGDVSDFLADHSLGELMERVDSAPKINGSYADYFQRTDDKEGSQSQPEEEKSPAHSQILIQLAGDCEFFSSPDGEVFGSVQIDEHRETWRLRSRGFRRWLVGQFYIQTNKAPGSQALSDALGVLEARAQFDGPEISVHRRLAEHEGKIYLDLCNAGWQAVEIDSLGWRVVDEPPVKFTRARGMLEIPLPVHGGRFVELRQFLNLEGDEAWRLTCAFIVATLRPKGPFPILILQGEQGSAKSSFARVIRSLIDPNSAPLRTYPREERDLAIAAKNGWLLAFDNISGLRDWLSDAFCRLSTGGGFATRELYSDSDETLFDAQVPIVLNGIDEIANRGDLRDRAVILNLPVIPEGSRRDESGFWQEFYKAHPRILGGFLDAVVIGLQNLPDVHLGVLPRMADFAKWATACEPAFGWEPGSFMKAYTGNRLHAVESGIEADPLAQAIRNHAETCQEWEGTATELLDILETKTPDQIIKKKSWPKAPNALSNKLKRLAPTLRAVGVEVEMGHKDSTAMRARSLIIRKVRKKTVRTVRTVQEPGFLFKNNELGSDDIGPYSGDFQKVSSESNHLNSKELDGPDGSDDDLQNFSNPEDQEPWEASI